MAQASADADLRPLLPDVSVPTLLLYGDHDERAPLHVAEGLRAGIPSSRLVVLPGVGHMCSIEAPEEVSRALGDFLRSASQDVVRAKAQRPRSG
jgi:pimeloyl-ACP methyl ester carboxylesterase